VPATVTYAKIIKKGKEGGMLHLEKVGFKILFIYTRKKNIHMSIEETVSCVHM